MTRAEFTKKYPTTNQMIVTVINAAFIVADASKAFDTYDARIAELEAELAPGRCERCTGMMPQRWGMCSQCQNHLREFYENNKQTKGAGE